MILLSETDGQKNPENLMIPASVLNKHKNDQIINFQHEKRKKIQLPEL